MKARKHVWKSQRIAKKKADVSLESSDEVVDKHISAEPANLEDSDGIIDHRLPPVIPDEQVAPYFCSPVGGFPVASGSCGNCCGVWRDSFEDANPSWWQDTFGCEWSRIFREVFDEPAGYVFDKNYNQILPLAVRRVLSEDVFDPL